jgi:hypothetical protein
VQVDTAQYQMTTEAIEVDMTHARLQSRTPVLAQGPLGTLRAGAMMVQENAGGLYLHFNSGVQLVYNPP